MATNLNMSGEIAVEDGDEFKTVDGLFWHFTQIDALPSIFRDGFRMTHSACLSDKLDGGLRNQIQVINCEITSRLYEVINNTTIGEDVKHAMFELARNDVINPAFIVCFSKDPNFGEMWSHYGRRGGIAMGIKKEFLINAQFKNASEKCSLMACDYGIWDELSVEIDKIKSEIVQTVTKLEGHKLVEYCEEFRPRLIEASNRVLLAKRERFAFEHEVRLVRIIEGRDEDFLSSIRESISQYCDKVYLSMKLGGQPRDWVGALKISPFGDVEGNFAKAAAFARLYGIPIGVQKESLPHYAMAEGCVQ